MWRTLEPDLGNASEGNAVWIIQYQ